MAILISTINKIKKTYNLIKNLHSENSTIDWFIFGDESL